MPSNEDFERARKEMSEGAPQGIFSKPTAVPGAPAPENDPDAEMVALKAHVADEKLLTRVLAVAQAGESRPMPSNPAGSKHLGFPVRQP